MYSHLFLILFSLVVFSPGSVEADVG